MECENSGQTEELRLHDNTDFYSNWFEPVWKDTPGYPGTMTSEIREFFPEDKAASMFKKLHGGQCIYQALLTTNWLAANYQIAGPPRAIFHLCGMSRLVSMNDNAASFKTKLWK